MPNNVTENYCPDTTCAYCETAPTAASSPLSSAMQSIDAGAFVNSYALPEFSWNNTTASYTQEVNTMPFTSYDPMLYCYMCDARAQQSSMQTCSSCSEYMCSPCMNTHDHNGEFCDSCGFFMLNGESTTVCPTCNQRACYNHMRNHRACGLGPYDPQDDGQYSGRPPVAGYGREARMTYIDSTYISDPLAVGKRSAALEVEVEYKHMDAPKGRERMVLPLSCGITHDGSLTNGIEVTTPPAKGRTLARLVDKVMTKLVEHGYDKDRTCGLHTHIDLRDHKGDFKFMAHLFNALIAVEDILFAMQSEDRHNSTFSIPMRNSFKFFDMYGQKSGDFDYTYYKQPKTQDGKYTMDREKERKYAGNRYMAFNFHSVFYRGSLECRLHEGTVSAEDALLWIDLLQAIIARVEQGHSYSAMKKLAEQHVTHNKVRQFFRYFGLDGRLRAFVDRRIRDGQGYDFVLGSIAWGVPVKGRPARHEPKSNSSRLRYVGSTVRCLDCSREWVLRGGQIECPGCWTRLINRYGERTYVRVMSTARRLREPRFNFDSLFRAVDGS